MDRKNKVDLFNEEYNLNNINLKLFQKASIDVDAKSIELSGKPTKTWQDVLKRFFSNKWNIIFITIFLAIVFTSVIAPWFSPHSATKQISDSSPRDIGLSKPSWYDGFGQMWRYISSHELNEIRKNAALDPLNPQIIGTPSYIPDSNNYKVLLSMPKLKMEFLPFGTDSIGKDVWTKLWVGTFWSLRLALIVALAETIIGVSIGIYLGMHVGKTTDTLVMRVVEIFSSVPALIWMVFFSMIIGTGFWSIALVLVVVGWVGPVYQARMFTIKIKDSEFISAARVSGTSNFGIVYKHILPNIIGRLIVGFVQRIPAVIFFEASLVFLGFHVGGDSALTLGNIINTARAHVLEQPWDILSASAVILAITVSLQIVANGLRDAFDVKVSG